MYNNDSSQLITFSAGGGGGSASFEFVEEIPDVDDAVLGTVYVRISDGAHYTLKPDDPNRDPGPVTSAFTVADVTGPNTYHGEEFADPAGAANGDWYFRLGGGAQAHRFRGRASGSWGPISSSDPAIIEALMGDDFIWMGRENGSGSVNFWRAGDFANAEIAVRHLRAWPVAGNPVTEAYDPNKVYVYFDEDLNMLRKITVLETESEADMVQLGGGLTYVDNVPSVADAQAGTIYVRNADLSLWALERDSVTVIDTPASAATNASGFAAENWDGTGAGNGDPALFLGELTAPPATGVLNQFYYDATAYWIRYNGSAWEQITSDTIRGHLGGDWMSDPPNMNTGLEGQFDSAAAAEDWFNRREYDSAFNYIYFDTNTNQVRRVTAVTPGSEAVAEVSHLEDAVVQISPAGSFLGPETNEFTGATRTAAEAARNTYATANAGWLAQYNADQSLLIHLTWTASPVGVVQRRNIAGTAWEDVTLVVTGPAGAAGAPATGPAVVTLLEALSGNARLNATALRLIAEAIDTELGQTTWRTGGGGGADTAAQILAKLLTVDGSGSGLDADLLDGMTPAEIAALGGGSPDTAAQILTKLLTVDGPGSGLNADLLDGTQLAALAQLAGAAFTGEVTVVSPSGGPLTVDGENAGNSTIMKIFTPATGSQKAFGAGREGEFDWVQFAGEVVTGKPGFALGPGTARDTNLYREEADHLRTDDEFSADEISVHGDLADTQANLGIRSQAQVDAQIAAAQGNEGFQDAVGAMAGDNLTYDDATGMLNATGGSGGGGTGDITGVTAGEGLSGGGDSGDVELTLDNNLPNADEAYENGDDLYGMPVWNADAGTDGEWQSLDPVFIANQASVPNWRNFPGSLSIRPNALFVQEGLSGLTLDNFDDNTGDSGRLSLDTASEVFQDGVGAMAGDNITYDDATGMLNATGGSGGGASITDASLDVDDPSNESTATGASRQSIAEAVRAALSIPRVASIPAANNGSDIIFLTHDTSVGAKANISLTVGVAGSIVGWRRSPALGSIATGEPGALSAVLGAGDASDYSVTQFSSPEFNFLDEIETVEINGTEYDISGHPPINVGANGQWELSFPSGGGHPTGLATAAISVNFQRDDNTWVYTNAATMAHTSGLYEWDPDEGTSGAYVKLTTGGTAGGATEELYSNRDTDGTTINVESGFGNAGTNNGEFELSRALAEADDNASLLIDIEYTTGPTASRVTHYVNHIISARSFRARSAVAVGAANSDQTESVYVHRFGNTPALTGWAEGRFIFARGRNTTSGNDILRLAAGANSTSPDLTGVKVRVVLMGGGAAASEAETTSAGRTLAERQIIGSSVSLGKTGLSFNPASGLGASLTTFVTTFDEVPVEDIHSFSALIRVAGRAAIPFNLDGRELEYLGEHEFGVSGWPFSNSFTGWVDTSLLPCAILICDRQVNGPQNIGVRPQRRWLGWALTNSDDLTTIAVFFEFNDANDAYVRARIMAFSEEESVEVEQMELRYWEDA